MENAIRSLMKENGISEIDLTEDEGIYGRAWVIRSNYYEGGLEEVQVTALKGSPDKLGGKILNFPEKVIPLCHE